MITKPELVILHGSNYGTICFNPYVDDLFNITKHDKFYIVDVFENEFTLSFDESDDQIFNSFQIFMKQKRLKCFKSVHLADFYKIDNKSVHFQIEPISETKFLMKCESI